MTCSSNTCIMQCDPFQPFTITLTVTAEAKQMSWCRGLSLKKMSTDFDKKRNWVDLGGDPDYFADSGFFTIMIS